MSFIRKTPNEITWTEKISSHDYLLSGEVVLVRLPKGQEQRHTPSRSGSQFQISPLTAERHPRWGGGRKTQLSQGTAQGPGQAPPLTRMNAQFSEALLSITEVEARGGEAEQQALGLDGDTGEGSNHGLEFV